MKRKASQDSDHKNAAAAAAKSLQSCLTLCDPIDSSPPGSSIHGIFQARILEWGAIAFSDKNAITNQIKRSRWNGFIHLFFATSCGI